MAITITLDVTVEGFATEKTAKGNHTARGVSFALKSVKGCDAKDLTLMAPNFGNNGTVLFMTKNEALVAKVNKARAAVGGKAKPVTIEDALAIIAADPDGAAKLLAMLKK